MQRLEGLKAQMLDAPDQQISLTDPDARSMATSGRGSGVVGYNVQTAVDTEHHLIVTHEVTNVGTDRSQLANMAKQAKATLETESLDAVADRGYFNSEEILACEQAGITVTLAQADDLGRKVRRTLRQAGLSLRGRGRRLRLPRRRTLTYRYTNEENGLVLRRYWTNVCGAARSSLSARRARERRVTRWEHEHLLEAVQRRLDADPGKMRVRRETVEHPFGTIKARMGATHFLMKTLPRVATEMALHVLAYNLTRVMNIMGVRPLMAAMQG